MLVFHKALSSSLLIRCLASSSELLLTIPQWLNYIHAAILKHPCLFLCVSPLFPVMMSALSLSKNRLEAQITTIRGGFKVSSCLPVLETMSPQHDETGMGAGGKERLLSDASSVTVSMVLRDQMRIRRLGSEYKNMRMFTRREGAGVETPRLDIEPWILAAAHTQACRSSEPA